MITASYAYNHFSIPMILHCFQMLFNTPHKCAEPSEEKRVPKTQPLYLDQYFFNNNNMMCSRAYRIGNLGTLMC